MTRLQETLPSISIAPIHTPSIASTTSRTNPANWLGALSPVLVAVGLIMILNGDPYWLALPISMLGSLAGHLCLRHGQKNHAWSHLGMNLGILNLCFWVLLIIIAPYVLGIPTNEIFVIPSYD